MKEVAAEVRACPCAQNPNPARSLLKMIAEHNYAKYSKYWV